MPHHLPTLVHRYGAVTSSTDLLERTSPVRMARSRSFSPVHSQNLPNVMSQDYTDVVKPRRMVRLMAYPARTRKDSSDGFPITLKKSKKANKPVVQATLTSFSKDPTDPKVFNSFVKFCGDSRADPWATRLRGYMPNLNFDAGATMPGPEPQNSLGRSTMERIADRTEEEKGVDVELEVALLARLNGNYKVICTGLGDQTNGALMGMSNEELSHFFSQAGDAFTKRGMGETDDEGVFVRARIAKYELKVRPTETTWVLPKIGLKVLQSKWLNITMLVTATKAWRHGYEVAKHRDHANLAQVMVQIKVVIQWKRIMKARYELREEHFRDYLESIHLSIPLLWIIFVRTWRKRRSVKLLKTFLGDMEPGQREKKRGPSLYEAVGLFLEKIQVAQRTAKAFIACNRARVYALGLMWERLAWEHRISLRAEVHHAPHGAGREETAPGESASSHAPGMREAAAKRQALKSTLFETESATLAGQDERMKAIALGYWVKKYTTISESTPRAPVARKTAAKKRAAMSSDLDGAFVVIHNALAAAKDEACNTIRNRAIQEFMTASRKTQVSMPLEIDASSLPNFSMEEMKVMVNSTHQGKKLILNKLGNGDVAGKIKYKHPFFLLYLRANDDLVSTMRSARVKALTKMANIEEGTDCNDNDPGNDDDEFHDDL